MKQVTVSIQLHYGANEDGANIETNGVPTTLVLESLNNIVKGLAQQILEEAAEVIPGPDQEKYFDSRLELDRKLLEDLIGKQPDVKPMITKTVCKTCGAGENEDCQNLPDPCDYESTKVPLVSTEVQEARYTFAQMIGFAKWYSGMDEAKVIAAYTRYLRETKP